MGTASTGVRAAIGEITLPETIRVCLFDLDGVLTQTAATHAAAWKEMFDAFLSAWSAQTGHPEAPFDAHADYERYVDGRPRLDGVKTFLDARAITLPVGDADAPPGTASLHALANWKNELLLRSLERGQIAVYDGSVQFVAAVRGTGRSTAVVSSSANTHAVLAATGMSDLFDAVVDGVVIVERDLKGKPAPDSFLAAAEELGVAPAAAAVFEDATAGVAAGRNGGFGWVVGVDRGGRRRALEAAGADVVVDDLSEIGVR
jgi:beta-phosphoglucomutase family hydrolase